MQGATTERKKVKVVRSKSIFGLKGKNLGILHGITDKYYQFWDGDDLLRTPKIWAEIIEVGEDEFNPWS